MSNVLNEEKKKQVIALGQLGWSLRQIQKHTGVRRETAGEYLKAAGVAVRPPCRDSPSRAITTFVLTYFLLAGFQVTIIGRF